MESESRAQQQELEQRLLGIEEERHTILSQAREEAELELEAVHEEIAQLRRKMSTIPLARAEAETTALELVSELDTDARVLEEIVAQPIERRVAPVPKVSKPEEAPRRGLRTGDRVFVNSLNAEGEIAAVHAGHDVEVQVGALRVHVDADNLEWRPSKKEPDDDRRYASSVHAAPTSSPGMELHVRGFMVDDAVPAVDEYLDQAYLAGLPWVHIVHGRGTGALRKAIRDHLRQHPLVKEYSKAPEDQGGDGVTVVRFVPL